MACAAILGALATRLDATTADQLPASLVEEMEMRRQAYGAHGGRRHWLNQLLPMHLQLLQVHSMEAVGHGLRKALAQLLRQRLGDLLALIRAPAPDEGLPPGAAQRRAMLRAAAAGDQEHLVGLQELSPEAFERRSLEAFWTRREYVAELHFRQLRPKPDSPAQRSLMQHAAPK